MLKKWDIWWAWFEYEDREGGKRRPVLVVSPSEVYILSAEITKHESRNMWGEHEIIKWKSANLPIPSTVRLTKLQRITPDDFDKRIGTLHPVDIEMIKEKLKDLLNEED